MRRKVVKRFHLTNAWAGEWTGPELEASSTSAAIEKVTIVCDGSSVE
ncbi:phage tail protein [Streptomyces chattanoogensis]